ncbi:peptidyl-tRNA hydrolase protein 1 [Apophysomyces ossiformis]|uniref:peptidyl-tRNA hydrolase n=1 Tax=Apophysomyces ossiformis TaxID=679940 RepID=A0A8H7BUT1_9FUNG|nr:peptidyl-tRNA hydrolase protein 1 [Apophysomyces ossiformis]
MMLLDHLAEQLNVTWSQNRSWKAIRELSIEQSNVYVFHDDLQRSLGKLSLKEGGSANGHNGIKSLVQSLRSDAFKRVRIGIGRPPTAEDNRSPEVVADFVLSKFTLSEINVLKTEVFPLLDTSAKGLETLCDRGQLWVKPKPRKQKIAVEKPIEAVIDPKAIIESNTS